jgi:hypothetical protein
MPASEPAAAARTWFSSHSKVSAPTISKLWSLVAFIVHAASAMTVFRPLAIAWTRWCDQKLQYNAQSLAYINMLGGLTHAKEFLPCVTTAYTVCARAQRKSATS